MKKINFHLLSIGILVISIFMISLLNFFDVFSVKFSNILIYIIFFILLSLNSFKIALKSKNKGIISGLKVSSLISLLIIVLKFIFKIKFTFNTLIYITLIYLFSTISSIYASNKKSSNS